MIYRFDKGELNTQLVELCFEGQPVSIEPQVLRLLQLLIEQHQQVLSKEHILAKIWRDRVVSDSSLSSCIKAARHAIGDNGEEQRLIRTIRGHGFRFVGNVEVIEKQPLSAAESHQTVSHSTVSPQHNKHPLKGREDELKQLQALLMETRRQQGQIALLAGCAGIGKTRLVEEVSQIATWENMQVIWGRCREDTGAPAYWPWRQLLMSHGQHQPLLKADKLPELYALIPELFEADNTQYSRQDDLPDEKSRFKLFHSIASVLSKSIHKQPLLIIFDDLHRADVLSLRLLEFVAIELTGKPIMIVGTYRNTDLISGHRFFDTLSEFSRLSNYHHVILGNLSATAVNAFVHQELPDVSSKLVSSLVERTEGHPLYLLETVRHLQQGGDPETLPVTLKAIINQRLICFSSETLHILRASAVIGRIFDISSLSHILAMDPLNVLQHIEPALAAGQLTEQSLPGSYQFSHTLIREALYDSLASSDCLYLHGNLAEYLEHSDGDVAQIAFHYHIAAPLGLSDKATEFAIKAGREASRVLAYEIAARSFQQALSTAKKEQRAEITLALGQAQLKAGESIKAINTFDQAARLSEKNAEYLIYAQAAIGMEDAMWRPGLLGNNALLLLQQALIYVGKSEVKLRLHLMCAQIRAQMISGCCTEKSKVLQQEAYHLAMALNDPEMLSRSLLAELHASQLETKTTELLRERIDIAERAALLARQANHNLLYVEVLSCQMQDLFMIGDIKRLESLLANQQLATDVSKQPFYHYYTELWRALFCCARGELERSEHYVNNALTLCRWLPGQDGEGVYGIQMFAIKRELGQLKGMSSVIERFVSNTNERAVWKPGLALIYAEIDQHSKAQALFDSLLDNNLASIPKDAMWVTCIAYLSEVCVILNLPHKADGLYQALLPYQYFNILIGANVGCLGSAARFLGLLATVMQEWNLAKKHFDFAIEMNDRQGFKIHSVHSRLGYAQMLSQRRKEGDRELMQKLLDETLDIATPIGMKTAIEKTLILRQRA